MKNSAKINREEIRRMIARAAWEDKGWAHSVTWSEHNLRWVRGYLACLHDFGFITLFEVCEHEAIVDRLILKINKML